MWAWVLGVAFAADGLEVRHIAHHGVDYTVVTVHLNQPEGPDLRLYGGHGGIYFGEAERRVRAEGRRMIAATNAGMYTPEIGPVGLFVADGGLHPTNGGFNPVLTIMALAFRTADHVARSL
jgi:uncharacterized protein YigE (DUF2233 family)